MYWLTACRPVAAIAVETQVLMFVSAQIEKSGAVILG
jgi:hypothetical protein